MLRDLSINNYRSLKDFQINGLTRVNLIVGANNSGKTSLLEAAYLLVNQGEPERLLELLRNRGEREERTTRVSGEGIRRSIVYQFAHLFGDRQFASGQMVEISSRKDRPLSFRMSSRSAVRQSRLLFDESIDPTEDETLPLELVFRYGSEIETIVPARDDGTADLRFFRSTPKANSHRFLTTNYLEYDALAALWDGIQATPEEEKVLDALRILEPAIERIVFLSRPTSNSGILLKQRGQSERLPLGSMGDGMRRILTLAISVSAAENGLLLVDEIDTGLYYRAQKDMWRLLIDSALRRNVQIFATTHSSDCINAFKDALVESQDTTIGKLIRLSLRSGKLQPVYFTAEDLAVAARQDIEVR